MDTHISTKIPHMPMQWVDIKADVYRQRLPGTAAGHRGSLLGLVI